MTDTFRPHYDPARFIYDEFQKESSYRNERNMDDWIYLERITVWNAAKDYALMHGLRIPTLEEVKKAEDLASGHIDYGSKWAYGVVEYMRKDKE